MSEASSEASTKLQNAFKHKIPVLYEGGVLEAFNDSRFTMPKLRESRLCLGCQQDMVSWIVRRLNAKTFIGVLFLWRANLTCSRGEDFLRIKQEPWASKEVLYHLNAGPIIDLLVVVEFQAFLCPDCLANHVEEICKLAGEPYVGRREYASLGKTVETVGDFGITASTEDPNDASTGSNVYSDSTVEPGELS